MDGRKGTFRCFSVQPTDITIMELEWYCCIEVWWIGTCWWCDCFVRCYSLYRPCKHAFRMCYTVNIRFFLTGAGMLQRARLFLAVLHVAWNQCIVIVFFQRSSYISSYTCSVRAFWGELFWAGTSHPEMSFTGYFCWVLRMRILVSGFSLSYMFINFLI